MPFCAGYYRIMEREKRISKRFKIIGIIGLISCIAVAYLLYQKLHNQEKTKAQYINPLISMTTVPKATITKQRIISKGNLIQRIQPFLQDNQTRFAIAIRNLKTGESYYFQEHEQFLTASLYKLWIMATVFQQIEQGVLDENTVLSDSVASLNSSFGISSYSAELTNGQITYTVDDALRQMIIYSSNYPAMLLTKSVKLTNVKSYLISHGLAESIVGNDLPISTAYDISLFLEKLYKGELGTSDSTKKMVNLLKQQSISHKLPKYLPEQIIIAHKTGELDGFTHDAGIIFSDHGDYVLVVLSETEVPTDSEEKIAEISKAVYNYFSYK